MTIENTGEYKEWLSQVEQDGLTLRDVPEVLKTESICLTAVQQDGWALRYVPEVLKTEGLCLAAVEQDGYALKYVIQPTDQLVTDPEQIARWNRILMQMGKTYPDSKKHLQAQLIRPLITQADTVIQLPAPVMDEIAILIEHCERLGVEIDSIKNLYCEKQAFQKPQSKHQLSDSAEFSL